MVAGSSRTFGSGPLFSLSVVWFVDMVLWLCARNSIGVGFESATCLRPQYHTAWRGREGSEVWGWSVEWGWNPK